MKRYIIPILLILILIIILLMIGDNKMTKQDKLIELLNKEVPHDILLQIRYSRSGNSNGNIDEHILEMDKLILIKEQRDMMGEPIKVTEYQIIKSDLDKIYKQIDKGILGLSGLPINYDFIALDAPSTSITFEYDNSNIGGNSHEWYTISYDTDIPTEGFKLLNELKDYIISLEKENNIIKTYEKEDE